MPQPPYSTSPNAINDFNNKVTSALRDGWSREFRMMLGFAALVLVANTAFSIYSLAFKYGDSSGDSFTLSGGASFEGRIRTFVTLGLLLCVAGLAIRKLIGVVTSLFGLLWLLLIYAWWKRKSLSFLRNSEAPDYSVFDPDFSHVGGLWGATWWDLTLFIVVVFLLVWLGSPLIRISRAHRPGLN